MKTKLANILSLLMLLFWGMGCLSGCAHTKKAFSELSKKVDSVFVSRHDTSYRNKKDSSNTVIDLHGVDIIIPDDSDPNNVNPADYFPPAELARIKKIFAPKTGFTAVKKNGYIQIHIDSATIGRQTSTIISSGKSSKVDSVHIKSDEHTKTKTVDRKGMNATWTIALILLVVGIIAYAIWRFSVFSKIKKLL